MIILNLLIKLLTFILIVVISPFLFVLSILVWIDTKGSPFYIQERGLTLEKYRFRLIKFRTIKDNVTLNNNFYQNSKSILKKPQLYRYVSQFGEFLRKTGLDELPQLINILKGEMNFFGPRALSLEDLSLIKNRFPELYERRNKLNIKPGLLGLWQVNKDLECTIDHLIQSDEIFEKSNNFQMRVKIFLKAMNIILFGFHIDSVVNGKKLKVYPVLVYASILTVFLAILYILS